MHAVPPDLAGARPPLASLRQVQDHQLRGALDLSPVRVLLIDGDTSNALRLGGMLKAQRVPSFHLSTAGTLDSAAALLSADPADVLLFNLTTCDVVALPGLALLQSLAGARPILVLAPESDEGLALKAVQQGASDYLLVEQLYDTLLVRSIRHVLEQHRAAEQRRQAEHALRVSERRYRSLFEQSRDAIFITDASYRIIEANNAAVDLLGFPRNELQGRPLDRLFAESAEGLRLEQQLYSVGWTGDVEARLQHASGTPIWCLFSAARRLDDNGAVHGYQAILHDITDRKQAEERLLHNAFHDPLTGLPNRALFIDRTSVALARWRREPSERCAVIFLDLDRFKVVNDSLGHAAGDAVLCHVAGLLTSSIRAEDTVARLGGDEFAVLLHGAANEEDAKRAAERIHASLAEPFEVAGQRVFTSASIGIALPVSHDEEPHDLLRNADLAMYRAKSDGPSRHAIYTPVMHSHAVDLMALETDLRLAVARSEFVLHFQPILALPDSRVVGFEALIRWAHPRRGLLLPRDFISVAEDTGLIVPMGWWALREACRHAASLIPLVAQPPFVAVNLSARQLVLPTLVDGVSTILAETGLPAELLSLEITENSLISNASVAADSLARLRDAGVRICIDDFGTGYSSLSYIHTFKVDSLKIDRSFIGCLEPHGKPAELVQTIISLASRLGMSTVAEGVETYEQLAQLQLLKPTSVQGFLFSRAIDSPAATALATRSLRGSVDPES
jgi:diguanylate cyclase (GGDEF)-like protein/PAS domain S-box-containing protein